MRIDYARPFADADPDGWQREYERCVHALDAWQGPQMFDENGQGLPEFDPNDIWEFLQDGSADDDEFRSLFAAERLGAAR